MKKELDYDLDEVKLEEIKLDYIKMTECFLKWFNVYRKDFKDVEKYEKHFEVLLEYFYIYNQKDIDSYRFSLKIKNYVKSNYNEICDFLDMFWELYKKKKLSKEELLNKLNKIGKDEKGKD